EGEHAFHAVAVPELEPYQARALLRAGSWQSAEAGTELTQRGKPVTQLMFLMSGCANVLIDGHQIAACAAGSLVGEMEIERGAPAVATVVASECVRYLALE